MPELLDAIIPQLPQAPEVIHTHQPRCDKPTKRRKELAITSAVLGILSLPWWLVVAMLIMDTESSNQPNQPILPFLFMLLEFVSIPAIICGHKARRRTRIMPDLYGGSNLAKFGLAIGYLGLGILTTLIISLPALAKAKEMAQARSCAIKMKQLMFSFKMWAIDYDGKYVFSVPTSQGGSMELCSPGNDGYDRNCVAHFMIMSNELKTTHILVCPADSSKRWAVNWHSLQSSNVSYLTHVATNVDERHSDKVLVLCPIHDHAVLVNGSVQLGPRFRRLADDPSFKKYTDPLPPLLDLPGRP